MPRNDDEEFAALTKIVQALANLAPSQQRRVLDYAVARFGAPDTPASDQLRLPGQL